MDRYSNKQEGENLKEKAYFSFKVTQICSAGLHAYSVAAAALAASTRGPGCVTFDIRWGLLAFGFNRKDYYAGAQDTWSSSGSLTLLLLVGRRWMVVFLNLYCNDTTGDPTQSTRPVTSPSTWSTQQVVTPLTGTFDPLSFATILDHDTNVFYAYSNGELFSLDMALLKSASSTAIPWVDVQKLDLPSGYQPVMVLAQNHVQFLDVPGLPAGSAKIFVIDCVQQEFAFVPDDGSAAYVINVEVRFIHWDSRGAGCRFDSTKHPKLIFHFYPRYGQLTLPWTRLSYTRSVFHSPVKAPIHLHGADVDGPEQEWVTEFALKIKTVERQDALPLYNIARPLPWCKVRYPVLLEIKERMHKRSYRLGYVPIVGDAWGLEGKIRPDDEL
ncbi:hypothetical protein BYT27DRAFT_7209346 [Phlegmacium glaucopus]|nr:hypothetical protein BYT27DRAFT_7209346 [Phlegmacium glaucopus]